MNTTHRSLIYNIYVVVGLSSLLLISSFCFFGLRPLIRVADRALYQSKERGRNRVTLDCGCVS